MKKKLLAVVLMASMVVTACGEKDVQHNSPDAENYVEKEQEQESVVTKNNALAGVYPAGDELVVVPMGTFSDAGQTDYCTVKLPSNYTGGAVSDLSLDEDTSFDMFDGGDTVASALENGWLETGYSISYILINSGETHNTSIYFNLMSAEEATYEAVKNMNIDYTEIGNSENPALYYVNESANVMGDMRLVYSVNPEVMLVIDYAGPLYDELGIKEIAENLYNIIEAI